MYSLKWRTVFVQAVFFLILHTFSIPIHTHTHTHTHTTLALYRFDSWMTIWQLLVGEAWGIIMSRGVQALDGWMAFYFMSYTTLMTLLITNLVIGIFVNANGKVNKANKKKGELTTMDMESMLTEKSGGKKYIVLSHPESIDDPVALRKIRTGCHTDETEKKEAEKKETEKGRGSHGSDGGMEMWGESKEDEIDGNSGSGDSVLRGGMRKGIGKLNRAVLSKATLHEQLECIQHLAAIVRRAMDDDGGSKSGERGASGEGGAEAGVVVDA